MVRLKVNMTAEQNYAVIDFNSTMVRLKVCMKDIRFTFALIFQFHYGTIKSPAVPTAYVVLFAFQFHYGTIKSTFII